MEKRILIIEDNALAAKAMASKLDTNGYETVVAMNGEAGLAAIDRQTFDLVLLDLGLPGMDGTEVLTLLRRKNDIPVIIVSAKNSDIDKVVGLGLGADDYIAKPASPIELVARVKAVLRRAASVARGSRWLAVGKLMIGMESHEVFRDKKNLELTAKEFDILKLLVTHPGIVFSKKAIYQNVWNDGAWFDDNSVSVHIRRLRAKIEDDASNPTIVSTVWGVGYKLDGTVTPVENPTLAA